MAIRTFAEPRNNKLKKLKSVKVANLDRLRLSMRRDKQRFDRSVWTSIYDAAEPSETSSAAMSGTSSPNYMKATTCSSAKKGSMRANSGNSTPSSAGSSSSRISARKSNLSSTAKSTLGRNKFPLDECSDPVGVEMKTSKTQKSLKRVSTFTRAKKISSKKSMKIRTRYSQFQDVSIDQGESSALGIEDFKKYAEIIGAEIDHEDIIEGLYANDGYDKETMVKDGLRHKGLLERTRSIKLTRLRSKRFSKRPPKSRFSGTTERMSNGAETSNAQPRYMKGTSSHEARKNSAKGLTRTSSLRPLRILAKIPSLRPRRSKVRKRPELTAESGRTVDRATHSSNLKRSEVPEQIELQSKRQESEGTSSLHVCRYSYCSLNGHHHHAPSPPLKEFIAAQRKSLRNEHGKQLESQSREDVDYFINVVNTDQSRQMEFDETHAATEIMNAALSAPEVEDDGLEYLIKIYVKPRRKWTIESTPRRGTEQISARDYDWKLAEASSEISLLEVRQEALNEGQHQPHGIFSVPNVEADNKTQHRISTSATSDEAFDPPTISKEMIESSQEKQIQSSDLKFPPGEDLTSVLDDKQNYTSIWHLIYQQFVPSDATMAIIKEVKEANEKEGGDANSSHENELDRELSKGSINSTEDGDFQEVATKNLDFDQSAVSRFVQDALHTILQRDAESVKRQSESEQNVVESLAGEIILPPTVSKEESIQDCDTLAGSETSSETEEKAQRMKQVCTSMQKETIPNEGGLPERQMSKSYIKLRKMFVTAKFIKAMERMKKISPRRPQHLSSEPTSEEERVYLRHLSMNVRKNTEEWMLDYALRQAISKLNPEQQRRVTQLVEAFETFTPDQKGKGAKTKLMEVNPTSNNELATQTSEDPEQFVKPEQATTTKDGQFSHMQGDRILPSQRDVPVEIILREDNNYQDKTAGQKFVQNYNENEISDSASDLPRDSCNLASFNAGVDNIMLGNESTSILEDPSPSPPKDSEVSHTGDMTNIFFNKNNYNSMWNMIYQHVASGKASTDEQDDKEQRGNESGCQEINDPESARSIYTSNQEDDMEDQNAGRKKYELDQSIAVKLVKEALNEILQRYEQSGDCQHISKDDRDGGDLKNIYISSGTSYSDEDTRTGQSVEKHINPESECKLHQRETTSLSLQQQVETNELKTPQRKMSKSNTKLRKAIATTRFIKAMERLRKSSPNKSQSHFSARDPKDEKVYLRHLSMCGRKNDEEWMLDHALRQVVSKMGPDQQRRVALLVQAFETVTPEQKENGIKCFSLETHADPGIVLATTTKELTKCLKEEKLQEHIHHEQDQQVPEKHDAELQLHIKDGSQKRCLQEDHAHQTADDILLPKTDKTTISESTLEFSQNDSITALGGFHEKYAIRAEENIGETEVFSSFMVGDTEVKTEGDVPTILSDKQKNTSLWHLIHQQVVSSDTTRDGGKEINEVAEEESQEMNDSYSGQISGTKEAANDEENQTTARNQSAAIKLVKEAIDAILKCHGPGSDQQSLKYPDIALDSDKDLSNRSTQTSTEEYSLQGGERAEKHRVPEPEDQLDGEEEISAALSEQANANNADTATRPMSKSYSKLKKMILTAKFIAAMERLRKTDWRKPRHTSPESASEKERVYLRHLSIHGRKFDEEWMLDYALRKVISSLAPDQQRKVTQLVEAFETVNPEVKEKGIKVNHQENEYALAPKSKTMEGDKEIVTSGPDSSMPCDDHSPRKDGKRFSLLEETPLNGSWQEDDHTEISNSKTELSSEAPDSNTKNLDIQYQIFPKARKEDIDANTTSESLQHGSLSGDHSPDCEQNTSKSILSDKRKTKSMWYLICQQVQLVSTAEAGSQLTGKSSEEDHINMNNSSLEVMTDETADDSDASSVTSELTENDAIKLVTEAIDNILNVPEYSDDKLISNTSTSDLEKEKSLSRGYSKLRNIIICNKFIKAMQKRQRNRPQNRKTLAFSAGSKAGKVPLKSSELGERKSTNEWMLDNVLQKVISGLAPGQQRRVALLINAFEKVNPDPEEGEKGLVSKRKEPADAISLVDNVKLEEDTVLTSSRSPSEFPNGSNLQLDSLAKTSSRELEVDGVWKDNCEYRTSSLSKEYVSNEDDLAEDGPVKIAMTPSVGLTTSSDASKDPAVVNCGDQAGNLLDEAYIGEQLVGNSEQAAKALQTTSQQDLEEGRKQTAPNSRMDKEKSTNLWGLILQHVKVDVSDEKETQTQSEVDTNEQIGCEKTMHEASQLSPEVSQDKDAGVLTPTSFEFHEKEAIKVVQEAINELLQPEQSGNNQPLSTCATSEQGINIQGYESDTGTSPSGAEIAEAEKSEDTVDISEEEKALQKENAAAIYSKMSKVIMCKRFIKAMDKMRKLKPEPAQEVSDTPHSDVQGSLTLRQTATGDKKSWEEGMLDHALQQVVGKLAPAQKKRVALLVQAFEKVGSQPEPTTSWRARAATS